MNEELTDPRGDLAHNLLKAGCETHLANLIAAEAGGSQAIADAEYLKDLGLNGGLFIQCLKCVQKFYLQEMGLSNPLDESVGH